MILMIKKMMCRMRKKNKNNKVQDGFKRLLNNIR